MKLRRLVRNFRKRKVFTVKLLLHYISTTLHTYSTLITKQRKANIQDLINKVTM